MTTIEQAKTKAGLIGVEHGENAAAWFLQDSIGGRATAGTERTTAQRILAGIEEGDPEVMDALPWADLSGQWADGYTPRQLLLDVGGNDGDAAFYDGLVSDLCDAYEDGFLAGVEGAVTGACRRLLAG